MEASTAAAPQTSVPQEGVPAQAAAAPVEEPAAEPQPEPTTGTVHLTDGKSVEITSIEHFLEQMAGDAGEAWVKVQQVSGKAISFLKSAVVAHE